MDDKLDEDPSGVLATPPPIDWQLFGKHADVMREAFEQDPVFDALIGICPDEQASDLFHRIKESADPVAFVNAEIELRARFADVVERWEAHSTDIQMQSVHKEYMDSSAPNEIVAMGPRVMPLIRAYIEAKNDSCILISGWYSVVREIMSVEFEIPGKIVGLIDELRSHLIQLIAQLEQRKNP